MSDGVNGEATRPGAGASRASDGHDPHAGAGRDSYYGQPILNAPAWKADIPAYLFLGGLAGASSVLAAGAQATRRPALARGAKVGAFGAIALSLGALVHDLGRPSRFLNMLRVFKPTSPMSVGTWILTAYAPAAGLAAASDVSGLLPGVGRAATGGAALLGPAVASYTSALVANTAVPAWHDGHREMPFVFVGSAAAAAAGWGLLGPAERPASRDRAGTAARRARRAHRARRLAGARAPRRRRRRRGLPRGDARAPHAHEPGADGRGSAHRAERRPSQPRRGRARRSDAAGRVGLHALRDLPRRHGVRTRPTAHGRPPTRAPGPISR